MLNLCYTNQSVNAAQWNNRCLFYDQYKIQKSRCFSTAAGDPNNASGNAVLIIQQSQWPVGHLSLQPLLIQSSSRYRAWRCATLARSYLPIKCHIRYSSVHQATRYSFVQDPCLLPQYTAIICKLVPFLRFSKLYSNVWTFRRLFVLLMGFLHSAGDPLVAARCNPLRAHKFFNCKFITELRQRLLACSAPLSLLPFSTNGPVWRFDSISEPVRDKA